MYTDSMQQEKECGKHTISTMSTEVYMIDNTHAYLHTQSHKIIQTHAQAHTHVHANKCTPRHKIPTTTFLMSPTYSNAYYCFVLNIAFLLYSSNPTSSCSHIRKQIRTVCVYESRPIFERKPHCFCFLCGVPFSPMPYSRNPLTRNHISAPM